jgi:transposase
VHPEGVAKGERRGYPSDVADEEWALVAPYLALCKEDAEQRDYRLRDVSMPCATWCGPAASRVICPTICPRGGGLSAGAAVDSRTLLRDHGGGSAHAAARFRRLARDYERLATTLGAFHFLACACLMLATLFRMLAQS